MVFLINVFGKLNTHTERSKSQSAPLTAHSSGVIWMEQFVFRNMYAYTHVHAIITSDRRGHALKESGEQYMGGLERKEKVEIL